MKTIISLLGMLLATLSMIALAKQGFEVGLVPALQLVLSYYDRIADLAFGWSEPFLTYGLKAICATARCEIMLYSYWKHVFVLMGVYFFRESAIARDSKLPATALFLTIWGATIALLSSLLAGSVQITTNEFKSNLIFVGIPILGVTIYDFIGAIWGALVLRNYSAKRHHQAPKSRYAYFGVQIARIFRRAIIGLLLATILLAVPKVREFSSPGLFVLGVLLVLFAVYLLFAGLERAETLREPSETILQAYLRSNTVRLGISMVGVFLGCFLFLLANAGLQLLGL